MTRRAIKTAALAVALSAWGPFCHVGFAQHDVDTGGDPLMLVFNKARHDAAWMVEQVIAAGVPLAVEQRVRNFLTDYGTALPEDIRGAEHVWHAGDVLDERCAVTNRRDTPSGPPNPRKIHLSLSRCRSALSATTAGDAVAVRTLIHEAAHHFGVSGSPSDEDFASRIATVVFNLWQSSRRAGAPHWQGTASTGAPSPRYRHTAVWTGEGDDPVHRQVIVWGGCNESPQPNREKCGQYLDTGAKLTVGRADGAGTPPNTSWQRISAPQAPYGRSLHTSIWTGDADVDVIKNKMIIFGGCRGSDVACSDSFATSACPGGTCDATRRDLAIYDAKSDRWSAASPIGEPTPRVMHSAVWTGDTMIVWGGLTGYQNPSIPDAALGDGGLLTFSEVLAAGRWNATPATNAPSARYGHTAIWTGLAHGMLVWGGCRRPGLTGCADAAGDGGFFVPALNDDGQVMTWTWTALDASTDVPGRVEHAAVWTGRYLIVWGGTNENGIVQGGALYDAATGRWLEMTSALPLGEDWRRGATAAWDGLQGRMIIWGGELADGTMPDTTLVYDPADGPGGRFSVAATDVAPIGRKGHTGLWVHDALVVWGGFGASRSFLATGGVLQP
jgi:hypothetical protein